MSTVTTTSTTQISSPPDVVWRELDLNFLNIADWAGGVVSSRLNPATSQGVNGSAYGGRICEIDGVGLTDERITQFDADRRSMTYRVQADGLPFFVDYLENTWTVRPGSGDGSAGQSLADTGNDGQGSIVEVKLTGVTKGILGGVGALALRRVLAKSVVGLPLDLKNHLERPA